VLSQVQERPDDGHGGTSTRDGALADTGKRDGLVIVRDVHVGENDGPRDRGALSLSTEAVIRGPWRLGAARQNFASGALAIARWPRPAILAYLSGRRVYQFP